MATRKDVIRLLKAAPFQPFIIIMDSGLRVLIQHPENVAYDPVVVTRNFFAISDGTWHILPWEKMSSLILLDIGQPLPSGHEQT